MQLVKRRGRMEIKLETIAMGKDLCIVITGGDRPHLGAVTAGSCYEAMQSITFDRHKEKVVVQLMAGILREAYTGNFVICCGIHLDSITQVEIKDSLELCKEAAQELAGLLQEDTTKVAVCGGQE